MASFMSDVTEIRRMPFADALAAGKVRPLPASLHAEYVTLNLGLRSRPALPLRVVYTPLCGTGDTTVGDVLRAAGYDVIVYEPQNTFDGSFSTVPLRLPNPEVPVAAQPALPLATERNADVVLCTDPDADRLGVYARDASGQWRYLNGNEIASILAYYLCLDPQGPRRSGLIIKTLVTTRTIGTIAQRSGCEIVGDLLVGFKYIADVLYQLETGGRFQGMEASPSSLVMAGEESHGVLMTPEIRDKDAAGGAMVLCELLSQLRAKGLLLTDYLDALALECGNHQNAARSIVMKGIRGVTLLADMMRSLREKPPAAFAGQPVLRSRDLLSPEFGPLRSDTERLSRNFLVYETASAQIVVRPSGTEPKAKIYVDVEGAALPGAAAGSRPDAGRFARDLAAAVSDDCIRRIGYKLSDTAALLPDYVDLDLKAGFDRDFAPELKRSMGELAGLASETQLAWFRERLAPFGAGSDPLDTAGRALVQLLSTITDEPAPALRELISQAVR
jgi:phosphoglucomutase/phosphomannomutase